MEDFDVDNPLGNNIGYLKSNSDQQSVHYQEIGIPKVVSIGNESDSNANFAAIAVIFVIVSILCGIVCFIAGSGIGGLWCYRKGRKDSREKVVKDRNYGIDDSL